jgi:hypothetical protein
MRDKSKQIALVSRIISTITRSAAVAREVWFEIKKVNARVAADLKKEIAARKNGQDDRAYRSANTSSGLKTNKAHMEFPLP